jgi:hypothetical protein
MAATTRSADTRVVPLDRIVLDERAFPREGVDGARVDEFAGLYRDELPNGNDPFPAVGCVEDRDGRLILFDGWHRISARRRVAGEYPGRGYEEIATRVVRADGRDAADHAYELAVECSAVGSKQLTQSERRAAAKRFRPDRPAREVAKLLGISHSTVVRARESKASADGANAPTSTPSDNGDTTRDAPRRTQRMTLEQLAYRTAGALSRLLDQARDESRSMLGLGKPNLTRAGTLAYKALQNSYGEDAPAVTRDLLALVNAMQDQAARGA